MRISKSSTYAIHIIIILIILLLSRWIDRQVLNAMAELKSFGEVNASTIIMGDSHAEGGIDEKAFNSVLNIALSAESYEYTYYKLKRFLAEGNEVENLLLSLPYHFCHKTSDNKVLLERYRSLLDSEYFFYKFKGLDIDGYLLIEYISCYFLPIGLLFDAYEYYNILHNKEEAPWVGGQLYHQESHVGDKKYLKAALDRHFYKSDHKVRKISYSKPQYLKKILSLCQDQNIQLIIVTIPVWPEYQQQIPREYVINLKNTVESLGNEVKYYDLNKEISHFQAADFKDYDHLNAQGAEKCTALIKDWLSGMDIRL